MAWLKGTPERQREQDLAPKIEAPDYDGADQEPLQGGSARIRRARAGKTREVAFGLPNRNNEAQTCRGAPGS